MQFRSSPVSVCSPTGTGLASSSGMRGNDHELDALWRILAGARADVVLAGHDHDYERFAMNADGEADPDGVRQFVAGTGGPRPLQIPQPQ